MAEVFLRKPKHTHMDLEAKAQESHDSFDSFFLGEHLVQAAVQTEDSFLSDAGCTRDAAVQTDLKPLLEQQVPIDFLTFIKTAQQHIRKQDLVQQTIHYFEFIIHLEQIKSEPLPEPGMDSKSNYQICCLWDPVQSLQLSLFVILRVALMKA